MFVWQAAWTQNQIVTTISPKTSYFPSTGMSYVDDFSKYFNIQLINMSGVSMDIYFTVELSCDFSVNNTQYFIRTKKEEQPAMPLTISPTTPVTVNRMILDQMLGGLGASAYETNYDQNRLMQDMLQLPEGQYRFCLTPYQWDGTHNPNPLQVGEKTCYTFTICYSGSAPEFTSPMTGLSSANLNNSNPANNLLNGGNTPEPTPGNTSDIRESSQYTVLPLSRQLVFNWTGVISNCLMPNDFDYVFKIVEVYANQNVQDAINQNGTLATLNNKASTTFIHDTMANRHFQLQPGHVYAAQVQAVLKKNIGTEILLGNDGKSQIIAFVWGDVPVVQPTNTNSSTSSSTSDNHAQVLSLIRSPYFVSPGQDKAAFDALKAAFSSEAALVPPAGSAPYITDVDAGDVPYYQVSVDDTLAVKWMPVRGDSVLRVNYTAELYEYAGGDINNSMIGQPVKSVSFTKQHPYNFSPSNTELLGIPTATWSNDLEEGYKYLLHLKAEAFYAYQQTTTYTITEYIHNTTSERDSLVQTVAFGSTIMNSDVVFAWGIDSNALDKVYPPQFSYPVDLTNKSWSDTLWTDLPEVGKHDDFQFRWKPTEGADYGDEVYYKLLVAKLPVGKKPEEVKDTLFIKDSITTTSYIDSTLFDSLKAGEQYLAVLWTYIKQKDDSSPHYNMLNEGKSLYATFKLLPKREYVADLNDKIKCYPNALDALSKDIITPKADSLIKNSVRLKMGDFPLVLQKATLNESKKTYSGEGYVVWHPLGIDVRLKVKVDSIQINKDYQIINGTAVSSATDSATYLPALMNDLNLDQWTNDDINRVVSYLGEIDQVKSYYDKFMKYGEKYAKRYGGLLGPLMGGDIATEVLTFPLSVTDKEITGSENVIFSVNNMFFSPTTALMNVWAIFAAQDDDYYIPFLANNICMDYQSLFGKPEQHIDLFMGRSYEKKLNDGYTLRFQASSNFADPKDGTVISIDSGKLQSVRAEIQLDFDPNDLLGLDKEGLPHKGNVVKASLMAEFTSWSDWVAKLYMDPFAVAGADRFTFFPTGKGMFYDHSSKKTPNEVHLTYEYLYGTPPPEDMTPEQRMALTKASNDWEGFYWDEVKVFLSDEISNTFSDEIDEPDSFVVYKYGINNTVVDSVHYNYPGRRINFGAKGMYIDKNGFTCDFFAHDILTASTKEGGGWAFSLDTITVSILKNNYKNGHIKGGFGIPLFKSDFRYDCEIGADSLMFAIHAKKNPMDLDLWAATVNLDSASTYFRLKKLYSESFTRVDFTLNGKITINGKKLKLPSDFSLVKFEDMHIRNFQMDGKNPDKQARTASTPEFEFDIGEWSFASPQKYIGYAPGVTEEDAVQDKELGSVKVGGFTFSLTSIDPIINYQGDDIQIGVKVVGGIKFVDDGTDMAVTTGFSFWGTVHPKKKYSVSGLGARLEKITLKDIDFHVFKMSGELAFDYDSAKSNNITGFSGNLSVSFLSVVKLSMSAGFGKSTDDKNEEYSWWFFDGSCRFSPGLSLGTVAINGFSGGFAYNMTPQKALNDPCFSAASLLAKAEENFDSENVSPSGLGGFKPQHNSWVANAGISLSFANQESTMNADGLVSVRFAKKHFSGIFIEANAYVVTQVNSSVPAGNNGHNKNPLIRATAIMGFERYAEYDYFRLSIAAYSKLSLSALMEGVSSTAVSETVVGVVHVGTSLVTNPNLSEKLDNLVKGSIDRDTEGKSEVGLNAYIKIPVEFELKRYKQKANGHKSGDVLWYFSIGKPDYNDRLTVSASLDLKIVSAKATFTFYLMVGNSFAYEFPPLTPDLEKFFYEKEEGKKMDASASEIASSRRISMEDKLKLQEGGGFCMGSSFSAHVGFSCFLYVDVDADLGFDVALLNVKGQGCPGHSQIGKNNFYALGRIYAALQGDVGLSINLGFWKGKFSLFKLGVGALMQGGGPNPSYCYGLLRFQVSLLDNLVRFNTSVDFALGEVCVPGAGDPLANVKLFQNVTPGFQSEAIAKSNSNVQSPLQVGTIVSNMPWDRDVLLAASEKDNVRRFRFVLVESQCHYYTQSGNSYVEPAGVGKVKYTGSRSDENVILFETGQGGFMENTLNKVELHARAFEKRTPLTGKNIVFNNGHGADVSYNVTGENKGQVLSKTPATGYKAWFDPTWEDDNGKITVKKYSADTILYFKTKPLGYTLDGQVVFTWPYNGEPIFLSREYVHSSESSPTPYCNLYLFQRKDYLFDKTKLSNAGKELKIYLLHVGLEDSDIEECSYTYYTNGALPYIKVALPKKEYNGTYGPRKLRFFVVEKNKYKSAEQAAVLNLSITEKKAEHKSRISSSTYNAAESAHKSNKRSSTVNIQNQQLEEIYDSKHTDGIDSMVFHRTKMKTGYKICSSVGELVYEWSWFVDGTAKTYGDYITTRFSSRGKTNLDLFAEVMKKAKFYDYTDHNYLYGSTVYDATASDVMATYGWVFAEYGPNDTKRYRSNCVSPPLAYLVLDRDRNTPLLKMHQKYFQHFLDLHKDFKETVLKTSRYSNNSGDYSYKSNPNTTNLSWGIESELNNILKGGLYKNTTTYFPEVDRRIKGGTTFTQCTNAGYNPTTWDVPCIIDVKLPSRATMGEHLFQFRFSGATSLGIGTYTSWTIRDYATVAIAKDIQMIHDFMQQNMFHVQNFGKKNWKGKVDYFNKCYSNSGMNAIFKYNNEYGAPGFPYDMYELYLVNHYMWAIDQLYPNRNYPTASGTRVTLYDKDNEFIYVDDMYSLQTKYLAKYWWSAAGQCLDHSKRGFDYEFYYRSSSTKYYDVKTNQANDGKQQYPSSQNAVLGEWYFKNLYNDFGNNITNYFNIYYLTSQQPNFETCLMNIAVAVKKRSSGDNTRVFYPNAILKMNDCFYNIPNKNDNGPVTGRIRHSGRLIMQEVSSGTYGF